MDKNRPQSSSIPGDFSATREASETPVLIELRGEDENKWLERRSHFFSRLKKKFRAILDMRIREHKTVREEVSDGFGRVLSSVYAALESKGMTNAEKKAEIARKLSEIRMNEAKIRNLDADTELKETEVIERLARLKAAELQAAQSALSKLIEGGYLHIVETNGSQLIILKEGLSLSRLTQVIAGKDGSDDGTTA
jgi:hypothetical protein